MGWMKGGGLGGFYNSGGQDLHYSPQTVRNINYADGSYRPPNTIQIGGTTGRIVSPFQAISRNELYLLSQVRRPPTAHPSPPPHLKLQPGWATCFTSCLLVTKG